MWGEEIVAIGQRTRGHHELTGRVWILWRQVGREKNCRLVYRNSSTVDEAVGKMVMMKLTKW